MSDPCATGFYHVIEERLIELECEELEEEIARADELLHREYTLAMSQVTNSSSL